MLLASPTIATMKIYFDQKVAVFKSENVNLIKKHIENKDEKSGDIKKISDNKNPKN
ncbi:hypothetical protein SDC9_156378 [bioreactor metagenome]|uniref:Uncharacterized protein n=1 Tax=bioreactor metagenome TaxID=1076179 RepID=A0A645F5E5_9ZZZZ